MDTILNTSTFEALSQWLQGKTETEPPGAAEFVSVLNDLYIKRRLQQDNRDNTRGTGSKLALSSILAEDCREKIEKGQPAIRSIETAQEIYQSVTGPRGRQVNEEAPAAAVPSSAVYDDDDLPPSDGELFSERERAKNLPKSEDGFIESGRDSLLLAETVYHYWGQLDREINKGRAASIHLVMLAMYICYGCSIAQRYTRIVSEKPQMWKYGIVFPRAYNKASQWPEKARESAAVLEKDAPEIAGLIKDILPRLAEKGISKTAERMRANGTPWSKCNKDHPEQWNTPLQDKDIEQWFKAALAKNTLL